jgi:hypothetical protein
MELSVVVRICIRSEKTVCIHAQIQKSFIIKCENFEEEKKHKKLINLMESVPFLTQLLFFRSHLFASDRRVVGGEMVGSIFIFCQYFFPF